MLLLWQKVFLITKDAMDKKLAVAGRADEEDTIVSDETLCL